ncbi:hypothetical protein AB0D32_19985 [Micromonospora sp. NPDC048170]|uniref:hypothetical protein n=1 Tax=Micromonospora sp. NPDC048170 TaxID=3154819 RepID=UPI0033FB5E8E
MTEPYQPQPPYQQPQPGDAYSSPQQPDGPPHQYQPGDGFGQQPPQQPVGFATAPAGKNRRTLIVAAAAAVGTLMMLTAAYAVYDGYIKEDSGVAACKAMRDGKTPSGGEDKGDDAKITEAEYREAREVFEDSRHEKIREHGTALMDIAWQVNQLPKGEEIGALAFMGPLGTHMSGLQTACADQGVIVNLSKD